MTNRELEQLNRQVSDEVKSVYEARFNGLQHLTVEGKTVVVTDVDGYWDGEDRDDEVYDMDDLIAEFAYRFEELTDITVKGLDIHIDVNGQNRVINKEIK